MNGLFNRLHARRTGVRRLPWLTVVVCAVLLLSGLPVVHAQSTQGVYALPGTLRAVEGKNYATALATFDGKLYGLLGKTPAVEQEIVRLRSLGPTLVVKVWGTLYPTGLTGLTSQDPEIVVDSIVSDAAPAEPTPVPATPTPGAPQATVAETAINVRSGPSTAYSIVSALNAGTTCPIIGRDAGTTWWNIRCANNVTGWVYAPLVIVTGSTAGVPVVNVAPPQPTPTPTAVPAPPVSGSAWRATFFNNRDLAGSPAATTQFNSLDFNWGTGAPLSNVQADNFSAKFERILGFQTGSYLIQFTVDDGVRLFIDGTLVLENWQESSVRTVSVQRVLSGNQAFRVEYFEAYGGAQLRMDIQQLSTAQDWQVSYFNNPQLAGNPVLVRGEPRHTQFPINLNWGTGSPAAGVVPVDQWSARFVGDFHFEGGDYHFAANVDDGIRLYLDNILLLDSWQPGYRSVGNAFRRLGPGNHRITVEYFDSAGSANLRVWWDKIVTPDGGDSGGSGGRDE